MIERSVSGISSRPIRKDRVAVELDASTGISYNGTTNTEPTKGLNGKIDYDRFYMAECEELSRERKLSMIENEELILQMLPPEEHQKAREQIQEYRDELAAEGAGGQKP
jgi:hypothetical protein